MKILLTIDFPPEVGGIQRYLSDRVNHLFTQSDCVIFGTTKKNQTATFNLPCPVFTCYTPLSRFNKKWSLIPMLFKVLSIACKEKEFLIEAGNMYAALPAFILSLFFKKFTYTVYCYGRELLSLRRKTIKSLLFRSVLNRAGIRCVLTNFTISLLHEAGITREHCIMPPRIDPRAYPDTGHVDHSDYVQLLSVGRLVPHKGHLILIEAVNKLPDTIEWRLVLAGSGSQYNTLRHSISNCTFPHRISIKTSLTDEQLSNEFRCADLFVFPSLTHESGVEGFGIVLLEAMMFKIPIIASDSGAIPEVLGNDCALLVPPGDSKALGEAIRILIDNIPLRKRLLTNAFNRLTERFVWNLKQ